MPTTRRELLRWLSTSTLLLTASSRAAAVVATDEGAPLDFPQGVASGDPQPDAVMLWTRAVPRHQQAQSSLRLQVSQDSEFTALVVDIQVPTLRENDYTVRAYVDGLQANQYYHYRFLGAGNTSSRHGRTRTAPEPGQGVDVNMAFVSCQNYEQAYFGAWARMLADDLQAADDEAIQFVLHLGDFIYERLWPNRPDGSANSRRVPPFPDGVSEEGRRHATSLADYRHLYKTYLQDPHLQAARARWPFICTWDDHEFSNDNYQAFSTYGGQPRSEPERKLAANQAWFEFIPTVLDELIDQPARDFRHPPLTATTAVDNDSAVDSLAIYRRLRWGSNLDILLTDSRSYRSEPCVSDDLAAQLGLPMNPVALVEMTDAGRDFNDGEPPPLLPWGAGDIPNPGYRRQPGSCLGAEQRRWFEDSLASSSARWKLWGNALPLLPMRLDLSAVPFSKYEDSVLIIDAWAGYPAEVRQLMRFVEDEKIPGLVSFSGDHHMHGVGTVSHSASDPEAPPVAVDFACAGISSTPMYEELLVIASEGYPEFQPLVLRAVEGQTEPVPVWNMTLLDGVQAAYTYSKTGLHGLARWLGPNQANPGLAYVDSQANGYGMARFEAETLQVELVSIEALRTEMSTPPPVHHRALFSLPRWTAGSEPQLQGPIFDGEPPFPFLPPTV